MRRRTGAARGLEAIADLDALDGLDTHEGLREPGVEPAVPVHVGTDSRRQTPDEDLGHSPECVAALADLVDELDSRSGGLLVEDANRVGVNRGEVTVARQWRVFGDTHRADGKRVAQGRDAQLGQESLRDRPERDARGCLPGARPFQDRASLVEAVLLHADQVSVSWARAGQLRASAGVEDGRVDGLRAHDLDPLGPLGVADADADGRTHREAVPHAGREREFILFELHASAAAVAELSTREVGTEIVEGKWDTSRESLEDRKEFWAVGFPGREPSKHWTILTRAARRSASRCAPRLPAEAVPTPRGR